MSIPTFTAQGVLPFDCEATIEELVSSVLVTGEGLNDPSWDSEWRGTLASNLGVVAHTFWEAGGVEELWVDGSFVEAVGRPGDVDLYYVLSPERARDPAAFRQRLNELEGEELWVWDPRLRRIFPDSPVPKPPFWGKYHVEVFRHVDGMGCGIPGPAGEELTFAQAFRQQRGTFQKKGIVRLVR